LISQERTRKLTNTFENSHAKNVGASPNSEDILSKKYASVVEIIKKMIEAAMQTKYDLPKDGSGTKSFRCLTESGTVGELYGRFKERGSSGCSEFRFTEKDVSIGASAVSTISPNQLLNRLHTPRRVAAPRNPPMNKQIAAPKRMDGISKVPT